MIKGMSYTVAMFQWSINDKGIGVREYVIVDKGLAWDQARKLMSENKGSWWYKEGKNYG